MVDPRILANDRWRAEEERAKEAFAAVLLEALGKLDYEIQTIDVDLIGKLCTFLNLQERERLLNWFDVTLGLD